MTTNASQGAALNFTGTTADSGQASYFSVNAGTSTIGVGANTGSNGIQNTYLGFNAGQSNSGSGTVAIGYGANAGATGPSSSSVIVGIHAGNMLYADDNVFLGADSAQNTITASRCVGIGARAFQNNISGWYNCAIGADCFANTGGSTRNVAAGASAGLNLKGTEGSVIIGYQAAYGNPLITSAGDGLIVLGNQAMYNIQSVQNAIAVGALSAYQATTAKNFIAIGAKSAYSTTSQADILAVGHNSAQYANFSGDCAALGHQSAMFATGGSMLALGNRAARTAAGQNIVAVGTDALNSTTDSPVGSCHDTLAVGALSGFDSAGSGCVYLGARSGQFSQGASCIFIGPDAGYSNSADYQFALGSGDSRLPLLQGNLDTQNYPFLSICGALKIKQAEPGGPSCMDDGVVLTKGDASWQIYIDDVDGLSVRKNGSPVAYFDSEEELAPGLDSTLQHHVSATDGLRALLCRGETPNGIPLTGCLVCSTGSISSVPEKSGKVLTDKMGIRVSCALPTVDLSAKATDKKCFGVIAGYETSRGTSRVYRTGGLNVIVAKEAGDRRIIVNQSGEGALWVCSEGGPIENGDYVCSSSIPWLSMRQRDDLRHNYSIAKVTMDCTFDEASECYETVSFDFNGEPMKASLLACVYTV
jgi:hypothetical protein